MLSMVGAHQRNHRLLYVCLYLGATAATSSGRRSRLLGGTASRETSAVLAFLHSADELQ